MHKERHSVPSYSWIPRFTIAQYIAVKHEIKDLNDLNDTLRGDSCVLAGLAAWRMTKGVYRFDDTLFKELTRTNINDTIPSSILNCLPEWCVYIDLGANSLEIQGDKIIGFYAYCDPTMDFDSLAILPVDAKEEIHLVQVKLDISLAENLHFGDRVTGQDMTALATMINLLLYLCSEEPDFDNGKPIKPRLVKTKKGLKVFPASGIKQWDVGMRIGAAINKSIGQHIDSTGGGIPKNRPRGHIRRAHWHLFWTGPKDKDRVPKIKWLPPIFVNIKKDEALPEIIHNVSV
jgi:hypothetical protein